MASCNLTDKMTRIHVLGACPGSRRRGVLAMWDEWHVKEGCPRNVG